VTPGLCVLGCGRRFGVLLCLELWEQELARHTLTITELNSRKKSLIAEASVSVTLDQEWVWLNINWL
jgi:hypothetical protein